MSKYLEDLQFDNYGKDSKCNECDKIKKNLKEK